MTQDKGTEAAFSGEYCDLFDPGTYSCVVFDCDSTFETLCGWPVFSLGSPAVRVAADESLYWGRAGSSLLAAAFAPTLKEKYNIQLGPMLF